MFKRVFADIPKYFFLLLVTAAILVPIYYMVMTSVKSHDEYLENKLNPPKRVTLENFREVFFEQKFLRLMYNSLRITLISGVICVVVSTLAAFAFSNYDFPLKNLLFVWILSLMSVPPIVMVIPLFIQFVKFRIIANPIGAIIIYVGLTIPFSVYLLTSFFKTTPKELQEAARIDGCSDLRYFLRILLPLSKPAIATCFIVNAVWIWNELLIALIFLQKDELRTLMAGIMLKIGKFQVNVPLVTSGLVIASLPMIILFLAFQKWFIRGLVEGAIKG
jgi:ABC-type glycerol-3-phosphate transport system permease component